MLGFIISVKEGLRDVIKNPLRSSITILATMLTAASIIFTTCLVEGTVKEYRNFLDRLGGVETFSINNSGRLTTHELRRELSQGLTLADVGAIEVAVPRIRAIAPVINHWPNQHFELEGRRFRNGIVGTTPEYLVATSRELDAGRFITDMDVALARRVLVLGPEAAQALGISADNFSEQSVRMGDMRFTVVGVLKSQAHWLDRLTVMPITTLISEFRYARIQNNVYEPAQTRLDNINVRVHSVRDLNDVIDAIRRVLIKSHNGVEDFGFDTREDWSEGVEERVRASETTGLFIVLVCLGVATLSIVNVLLAALRQRIREIGIRMSIGCRPGQVFLQVLSESVFLCLAGSLAGVFVGSWLTDVMSELSPRVLPVVTLDQKIFVFTIVVCAGVAAGFLPALRGARLKPIQALQADI